MPRPPSQPLPFTAGALLHLPGIGPHTVRRLRAGGVVTLHDILARHGAELPGFGDCAPALVQAARRTLAAIEAGDIGHLIATLHRTDQWRILADFHHRATYLDIETTGEVEGPEVTLIVCRHRGRLPVFTAGDNLDACLPLLDEVELLVTFNGATFDIPQLERHFHIPLTHIPHLDLRWVCHHAGLRGGLKRIEQRIGLIRPADILGVDGGAADWIWQCWRATGDPTQLARLTRYCAADVVSLHHLTNWLIAHHTGATCPPFDWHELPAPIAAPAPREHDPGTPLPAPARSPLQTRTARDRRLRERLRAYRSG